MSDPGVNVQATLRYEVRLVRGPYRFMLKGVWFALEENEDIVCLIEAVTSGITCISETIIGVIGDEGRGGAIQFLKLRAFMVKGGVIGLHQELA